MIQEMFNTQLAMWQKLSQKVCMHGKAFKGENVTAIVMVFNHRYNHY